MRILLRFLNSIENSYSKNNSLNIVKSANHDHNNECKIIILKLLFNEINFKTLLNYRMS